MKKHSSHGQAKEHLMTQVQTRIFELFGNACSDTKKQLVEVFGAQLSLEDWQDKEVDDIAGCCESLWLLMQEALPIPRVQVFNPSMEEHGWTCSGTVIMIRQLDMPFLVDSIRLELNRRGSRIHLIKSTLLSVLRNDQGTAESIVAPHPNTPTAPPWQQEALMVIEVGVMSDPLERSALRDALKDVLENVSYVVSDYHSILGASEQLRNNLQALGGETFAEVCAFLKWLEESHFTYLGFREFDCIRNESGEITGLKENLDAQLGLFKKYSKDSSEVDFGEGSQSFYASQEQISISKSSTRSSVHRSVYPDYIVIKKFDSQGSVVGEARILGLFTYSVYTLNTQEIPIIRQKVARLVACSQLLPQSHDGKNLQRVIETYPRDELFQADFDSLYTDIMRAASVNEKGAVCLIMRTDAFQKFVNVIVYVPRDSYSTQVRKKIETLIGAVIDSKALDSTTYFSESILARAYMVFQLSEGAQVQYDVSSLESSIHDIARGWDARLNAVLVDHFGDREGEVLYQRYKAAFSLGYQEHFDTRTAVSDIRLLESLSDDQPIAMHFFQPVHGDQQQMRFKVLHRETALELSEVIPILEHLGLRVLTEHPYQLNPGDGNAVWLHDFCLRFGLECQLDVGTVSKLFESAFSAIWMGKADSDSFNRLVLGARLDWREVAMLRGYAAYMKQTTFAFSQDYIADTLVAQSDITRNLVALFKTTFDPRLNTHSDSAEARIERLEEKIVNALDAVENLNEDRILRRYLEVLRATLRTNFYQVDELANGKPYMAFKFSPKQLVDIPDPKPEFEVYVYSPRMEGVHLRGGKVARGGIRWSDRQQDFRTEVLGLVKAQQVKNAVIVPTGAKGGFICKRQHLLSDRESVLHEGVECYKMLMRGLLDMTDNIIEGEVVPPNQVVARDEPDPYLVVAADKGTATFSDIANTVSLEYQHWLGDAFASGGSQGYDHKKMGITAKGAWVSVQRHFRELGKDIQTEPFTVIGIGDMAGDVFGNGMLLSESIQLVAAFNHAHIFIDPNPNCAKSYEERKRLFDLPRSSWEDYNRDCLSEGGGIFSRSAKVVTITPQMQACFGIDEAQLSPNEFIRRLLSAPVDLIWNGGIGTYVKHSLQSHMEVGDKANDVLRVNGKDLRCKVFGEGGNLGMTQLGRVEFCLNGGACNTDFIDNAAGVDCSDHEVNIKILLQAVMTAGDLTVKQRNQLLESMTSRVASLVLHNNYRQTLALSLAQFQANSRFGEMKRFIRDLEKRGRLNRELEYLPSEEVLLDRERHNQPFSRPEMAVLLSYAKVELKEWLSSEASLSESIFTQYLYSAFPEVISEKFKDALHQHPLSKEIIATQLANDMVHILGITAAHRLANSTGSEIKSVAVAFVMAKSIYKMDAFIEDMREQDNIIPAGVQYDLIANMARRVRRATRWFLKNRRGEFQPEQEIALFDEGISKMNASVESALSGDLKANWDQRVSELNAAGVPERWVPQLAVPHYLFSGISAVEAASLFQVPPELSGFALFRCYQLFELDWLAKELSFMALNNAWQAKARETYLDEIDNQLRKMVAKIFSNIESPTSDNVTLWLTQNSHLVDYWHELIESVKQEDQLDFAVFSVMIGELVDIVGNRMIGNDG